MEIHTPKDGSRIAQEQNTVLISGKVSTQEARATNVDIVFVLDISGSTAQYAGQASAIRTDPLWIHRDQEAADRHLWRGLWHHRTTCQDLRNSSWPLRLRQPAAISQLDPNSTRVGLISFSEDAKLLHPLTHDFDRVKSVLDEVLRRGTAEPHGRRDTSRNQGAHGVRSEPAAR